MDYVIGKFKMENIRDKIKENDLRELFEYKRLSLVYPQFKVFDEIYKRKREDSVEKYQKGGRK